MKEHGRYFKSRKEAENALGRIIYTSKCPSIHVSGSIKGMREQFWGKYCDVVRIGNYIYKIN